MKAKRGGVPTTPRFHEDDHVVLKAPVTGTNRLMRSSYMHHLPAGLKGIINSTKFRDHQISENEQKRIGMVVDAVRGSDGFADVIIMRVPDVKLEHAPD